MNTCAAGLDGPPRGPKGPRHMNTCGAGLDGPPRGPKGPRHMNTCGAGLDGPPRGPKGPRHMNTEPPVLRLVLVALLCAFFAQVAGNAQGSVAAAAKKEGTLTLYTTIAEKDLPILVKPFEAKYGVKVVVWRAGTDKVLQRTVVEAAAKKYDVDVI